MEFKLTDNQVKLYKDWTEKHISSCKYYDPNLKIRNVGIGGTPDTFCFNPSMFGDIVTVKCACGEKLDLTEWS